MPADENWLSLKISESAATKRHEKTAIVVSIPKKTVRLATQRNRLKRLIREATRLDTFFKDPAKRYSFRVHSFPAAANFHEVNRTIKGLIK